MSGTAFSTTWGVRRSFGEWVWTCSCSPDPHGGYATAKAAVVDGLFHQMTEHGSQVERHMAMRERDAANRADLA